MTEISLKIIALAYRFFYPAARASRAQFITGTLFSILMVFGVFVFFSLLDFLAPNKVTSNISSVFALPFLVLILMAFAGFAFLSVRRLHDLGCSGFYALVYFVPILNFLTFLLLVFKKGQNGENQFGDDPICQEMKIPELKIN